MAQTPNERQDDTNLRVAVGVIQSQMADMKTVVARIEKKIDNQSYVHQSEYSEDRKADAATYATKAEVTAVKDEQKPIKNMFYAVLTAIVIAIATAIVQFLPRLSGNG